MRLIAVFAATGMLAACAQIEQVPGAGGRPNYAINCPAGDLSVCFTKAREICPAGYNVVSLRRPPSLVAPLVWQDQVVVGCM